MTSRPIQLASLLCTLLPVISLSRAQTAPTSRPTVPLEMVKVGNRMYARHTGTYQPLQLLWNLSAAEHDIIAVYPHPLASNEILLATDAGLLLSSDAGQTFNALPQASAHRIGPVTSIAFAPDDPGKFYIATSTHGLWVSKDHGQTIAQLATKGTGLASDIVRTVLVAPEDPMHRTIIALNGDDAPGLSQSSDGGRTWHTLFPDQHILQLFWISPGSQEILVEAAAVATPDARMVYYTPSLQEPWQKLLSDVTVTGAASPQRDRDGTIILATAERGLFRIARQGGAVINVGPTDQADWASFGVTHSPTADQQLFYAYQPKHLGLVLFTANQLKGAPVADADPPPASGPSGLSPGEPPGTQYATASDGLFTGPLVMDGAHIRANASGTIFFAAVNKQLYRGVAAGMDLNIANVTVTPPVLLMNVARVKEYQAIVADDLTAIAASHSITAAATGTLGSQLETHLKALDIQRFTISATIQGTQPPAAVTVDLTRLGLSARAPLFDDGRHDDGAAGDGVWADKFSVDFSNIERNDQDWRSGPPGPVPLSVTAISDHQTLAGAVGQLALYTRQTAIPFLDNSKPVRVDGNVSGSIAGASRLHQSLQTILVKAAGPWSVALHGRTVSDISGQAVLAFYIRSPQETDSEVNVQLGDQPTYSRPLQTLPVPLLAEGFVADHKITRTDQRVVIPLSRLLQGAGNFQPSLTANLFLSGNATGPFDLVIHDISFLPSDDAPNDAAEEKP